MKCLVFNMVVFVLSSLAVGATGGGSSERNVSIEPKTQETAAETSHKQRPTRNRRDPELERMQEHEESASAEKPTRVAVVVSRNNPVESLTRQELRQVFLRQKTRWPNGWKITIFERRTEDPIREQFSKAVLGKRPSELREYWLNLKLTRGLKPPKVCPSTKLLAQYLRRVKGGIGYLHEHEVDKRLLKIVNVEGLDAIMRPENDDQQKGMEAVGGKGR